MKKLKIYLDTSVISHLQANDAPEKMVCTLKLWEEIKKGEYLVAISEVVISEIDDCPEPKKTALQQYLNELKYEKIVLNGDIVELANSYIAQKILPAKCLEDALHIAAATIHGCHAIISWNFKHIVNLKTFFGVNGVNKLFGYGEMFIAPPNEIAMEEE